MNTKHKIYWPHRYNLMGVDVSATSYAETVDKLFEAVMAGVPAIASFHAVHSVVTASGDPTLRERVNSFNIVAPDGQPVRWALNTLYKTSLRYRVDGPETMRYVCRRAAAEKTPIYLYGGANEQVLDQLIAELNRQYPGIVVAGAESPPFRPLTAEEDAAVVERINSSGAKFIFIGLGSPKQDHFAYEHRDSIRAVQLCVGAAFDFLAGTKKQAPHWMQRNGLEWLYRACSEPRRLGKRYLTTNSIFVYKFLRQCLSQKLLTRKAKPTAQEA